MQRWFSFCIWYVWHIQNLFTFLEQYMVPPFSTILLKVTLNLQLYFGVNERDVYICRKLYFNHTCSIFIINHNHNSKLTKSKIQQKCWHTWWCYHIFTTFSFLVYITAIDVNDTLAIGDFIELWKHRSHPLCCACRDNDGWVGNQCTLLQYKWYYEAFSEWYCFQNPYRTDVAPLLLLILFNH